MIAAIWDKLDPGFFAPVWLLVGLVAMLAVALLEIGGYRRRTQAVRFFAAPHLAATLTASVSPTRRLVKSVLLVAATGLLFTAMARPHLFYDWQDEVRSGVDVLLAVDCSKSMLTEDVKPSRIERAKLAIADFADQLPENRLGLIAFAGDAFLQCPLTLDHDAFQDAVQDLDTDTIPRPGTDIATAINLAVDALKSQPNNAKFVILVTDGEDLENRALDAAKNAAQAGLKIYTVGVGTPAGDRILERDQTGALSYHQDTNGGEVVSKLDEGTLQQIADITGGAYAPLGQRGEGLDDIYKRYIEPLPKQDVEERRERIRIEQFEWPLALGTLLLMWEFMLTDRASGRTGAPQPGEPTQTATSRRPFRRRTREAVGAVSAIAGVILLQAALGPLRAADAETAEQDYKSGKFEESKQHYQKAVDIDPSRRDFQFNRGDAAYKAGEYSEAEEAFRKALETPDLDLQENAYFNLGNAQFQHGDAMKSVDTTKAISLWEQALHSYDSALKLRTNTDARHNYDFVKGKLEELKRQKQQQDQNKDKQGQSNPDDNAQSGQNSKQGQGKDSQQNKSGQANGQSNGQASAQPSQPGDKPGQQSSSTPQDGATKKLKTYSGTRAEDQKDPNIKSKEDAENLLDSLKDDTHRISARSLNDNNQLPPPPSGKDW